MLIDLKKNCYYKKNALEGRKEQEKCLNKTTKRNMKEVKGKENNYIHYIYHIDYGIIRNINIMSI